MISAPALLMEVTDSSIAFSSSSQPNWAALLQHPQAKLHLYGKQSARPGRKMGHFTCVDTQLEQALALAQTIRAQL